MAIPNLLKALIDRNEREIRRLRKIVEKINALEPKMRALSDKELRAKTDEFRRRLEKGETLDDLLVEAYAVVREVGRRVLNMRHFDVQLMGGIVLHEGKIAEMKTGEGKTLVATLPVYLNALTGRGVHVVTANNYLAKRDVQWMGPIYHFLGLKVGLLQPQMGPKSDPEPAFIYDPSSEEDERFLHLRPCRRREAYEADITYGTVAEFGFDYLRDNLASSADELRQRELNYAIIDEVDFILIDEARTPLIISGVAERPTELYIKCDRIIRRLEPEKDYKVDEKSRTAHLTEEGMRKVERALGIDDLSNPRNLEVAQIVNACLRAHTLFKRDKDYVVKDGQVIIVDEFTGRLMYGRRYSDGLHQALEAKEGVPIQEESQTIASITIQNYFRMYRKLAGMTGTAKTEEEEFLEIYGMPVVVIPTYKPIIRVDYPDVVYKTEEAKFRAVVREILQMWIIRRPVLVGTRSIEVSERLSMRLDAEPLQILALTMLIKRRLDELVKAKELSKREAEEVRRQLNRKLDTLSRSQVVRIARKFGVNPNLNSPENVRKLLEIIGIDPESPEYADRLREALSKGIPHNVLNAKHHEREAQIIAEAGRPGAVTVATNMAGRGVDIILGGKPNPEELCPEWKKWVEARNRGEEVGPPPCGQEMPHNKEYHEVVKLGGLHIIGTERHESRRIDNQLRGRAGRLGDPGSSRFYISMEDELMRLFGTEKRQFLLSRWPEDEPAEGKFISKLIENAQKKVEMHNFDIRKYVLKYDDVLNYQREIIYDERRKILLGADMKANVLDMIRHCVRKAVQIYAPDRVRPEEWDIQGLYKAIVDLMPPLLERVRLEDLNIPDNKAIEELLYNAAVQAYEEKEAEFGPERMREVERYIMLRIIDMKWMNHLEDMDYLREGIHLRAYGQVDPVIAYQKEAGQMFEELLDSIREDVVYYLFRVQPEYEAKPYRTPVRVVSQTAPDGGTTTDEEARPRRAKSAPRAARRRRKVGRNDPCPCGSGKKYKHCCWEKDRQRAMAMEEAFEEE